MPNITSPLVKPETGTNIFVCPRPNCGQKFQTHALFTEHWVAVHVGGMAALPRGPVFSQAATPQAVGGAEVTCPTCQRKVLGSDYPEHAKLHAGGGITAAQFNQDGEPT